MFLPCQASCLLGRSRILNTVLTLAIIPAGLVAFKTSARAVSFAFISKSVRVKFIRHWQYKQMRISFSDVYFETAIRVVTCSTDCVHAISFRRWIPLLAAWRDEFSPSQVCSFDLVPVPKRTGWIFWKVSLQLARGVCKLDISMSTLGVQCPEWKLEEEGWECFPSLPTHP